jgi:RNA polymerase sigma factor (sigma-70 family)
MAPINAAQLAELFEAHAAGLVLYLRQWLDRPAAEDVVQEVFVRLLAQPRRPENVRAWLFRVARNQAINHARSGRRRSRRERAAARADLFEPGAADSIDLSEAQSALEGLPPSQREIVVLRIWGGMSFSEIGQLTGTAVSTLFDQYGTALAAMRRKIESPCKTNRD